MSRSASGGRLELHRIAPSGRSLLTGLLLLLAALGLYALARTTSAFAVERVAVEGAPPEVAAQVRKALAPALGESLLVVDLEELGRRVSNVPSVAAVSFDRSFPNTLALDVVPEVPVAVLRQGSSAWLAAASGRVVSELARGEGRGLPRVWLPRDVDVRVGESLRGGELKAVVAVAPLVEAPLPAAVAAVGAGRGELTLTLRSGLELRLGDTTDLAVKLEVARQILPRLGRVDGYLDVSVPERPVAGESLKSKVEVEEGPSTTR